MSENTNSIETMAEVRPKKKKEIAPTEIMPKIIKIIPMVVLSGLKPIDKIK